MVCTTSGTTKQAPKPPRISTEANPYVEHAFLVQLRANVRKFSHRLFFVLVLKSCTSQVMLVYAIQAIRRHY